MFQDAGMRWSLACLVVVGCGHSGSTEPPAPAAAPPVVVPDASENCVVEGPTFTSDGMTLHGYLFEPEGSGPFPAIVMNHGSAEMVGSGKLVSKFYVDHGYVVFYPHRRGHGRSRKAAPYMNHLFDMGVPEDPVKLTAELVAQSDDVMAAVDYVASLPEVDPKPIAVIGCSFGGIETLFAAERGTKLVAAVDFAGAAEAWAEDPPLRDRMLQAARNAKVPVFFIQAENDFDTTPSKVLSAAMKAAGKPMQVHIFPPFGTTHRDGHSFCGGGDDPAWGDEVLTFLAENMPIAP
jgi:carboxymethylenebutenolidase